MSDLIGEGRALKLLKKLLQTPYAANTTHLLEGRTPLHYAIDQQAKKLGVWNIKNQHPRKTRLFHASPPEVGNVASQFAETHDTPVAPTPTRWRSGNVMQPVSTMAAQMSVSIDENEGQERWQPGGSSRASEARSGIRQRKILQKSWIGRPKHQISLLDASKRAQVVVGALEAAQTQQQEMYQMVREQVQAHLAEELSNWRAEQQIHEGIYLERITNLEQEVSKLRTELTEAQCTIQQPGLYHGLGN